MLMFVHQSLLKEVKGMERRRRIIRGFSSGRLHSESLYLSARQPDTTMDGSAIESMSASVRLRSRKTVNNTTQQISQIFTVSLAHYSAFSLYL